MRRQTFPNYLRKSIIEMTQIERFQLNKLAPASEKSIRLRVPLLLYLVTTKEPDQIKALLSGASLEEYISVFEGIKDPLAESRSLPLPYQRVISGYVRMSEAHKAENESKRLIAKRIAQRRAGLELSDYRICRELGINPGNFNSFFYHGNDNALSLEKVKLIYRFVEFCRERLL